MLHTQKLAGFPIKRLMSTSRTVLEQLKERALIRVSGPEVSDYLQGLITNDMKHLSGGPGSMYTMFLNTQGRIMYDAVIYRPAEDDTYIIECDKTVQEKLQRHLKMYKVRRKLDIANLDSEYQVYVLFNIADAQISSKNDENASALAEANIVPCQSLSETLPHNYMKIHKSLTIYKDPRTALLGSRILSKCDSKDTETQVRDITGLSDTNSENTRNYRWLRYYLGIGEGTNDLPPGNSFPLECNCDYLHGVSFHKGCYIGQELTARVHHTGVVRKRLMPIYFTKVPTKLPDESIVQDGENLGKFRGMEQDVGLGLLRIAKVLKYKEIKIGNGIGVARKPQWWPLEAPKDISVNKSAI